jgi:ppGpp synthetase/RelA/SpoT-type nucleotidyltranferase
MAQLRSSLEKKNLEAHVDLCAERYDRMAQNILDLDKRIDNIEIMLKEIHTVMQSRERQENNRWSRSKDVIIGALASVSAYLIVVQFM